MAVANSPNLQPANLAPVEPISQHVRIRPQDPPLEDYIPQLIEFYRAEQQPAFRELHLTWELITHFMEGRQVLRRAKNGLSWRVYSRPSTTKSPIEALPKLGFHSRGILSRWMASKTDCEVTGEDNSDESQATGRAGKHILQYLEELNYTALFKAHECLNGQTTGGYARYHYFDKDAADSPVASIPVDSTFSGKVGPDIYTCGDCGMTGSADELMSSPTGLAAGGFASATGAGLCPGCFSNKVQVQSSNTAELPGVSGFEKKKAGRPKVMQVSLFELLFDLARPLEKSMFLGWDRRVRLEEVTALWPELNIQADASTSTAHNAQNRIITATPFATGSSTNADHQPRMVNYGQWWFDPAVYANYVNPRDCKTVSGRTILAGEKLIDVFPDGMCVIYLHDQRLILSMYGDHHAKKWVSAPYHVKLLSGIGYGIGEVVEAQRQLNLILAQLFQQIRSSTTPGAIYDAQVIQPNDANRIGLPGENVPANTGALPEGKGLRDAIHFLESQSVSPHVMAYVQFLLGVMETGSDNVAFSGALPGVNNKTATGAQIGSSLAAQQTDPQHQLRAEADEKSGMIMLELFQQNTPDDVFIPGIGRQGLMEGQYFNGADLQTAIRIKAKEGSWRSRTEVEQQDAFMKALEMLAGFGGPENAPPSIVSQVSELCGIQFDSDLYSAQERLCRIRIDQIKKALPLAQQFVATMPVPPPQVDPVSGQVIPADPMGQMGAMLLGIVRPAIEVEEPGHQESIDYLRRWFLSDEGIFGDDILRGAIKAMIQQHAQCLMQESMIVGEIASAGAPEMPVEQGGLNSESGGKNSPPQQKPKSSPLQQRTSQARAGMKTPQAQRMAA